MFNSYEFSFSGESSFMYGLMIYDIGGNGQESVSFGNTASIIETRTVNRVQPIHFGVDYNSSPLEFKLVFGSDVPLDRYQLEDVSMWLTGHQQYQWLSIDQPDMNHVQFKCLITSLTPIYNSWLPVAFEAQIRCDCPYAYGDLFEFIYPINGTTDILFRNNSSIREYLRPNLVIRPSSGVTEIKIKNKSDNNREFIIKDMPSSDLEIHVDNLNGIIAEKNFDYNLYSGFNMNFLRLVQGDNVLEIVGDSSLQISGRFMHNVAG